MKLEGCRRHSRRIVVLINQARNTGTKWCFHVRAGWFSNVQRAKEQALIPTKNGLPAMACVEAMQKCVRRGKEREAMEFAVELMHTSKAFHSLVCKRLEIISHEDIDTQADPRIVPFVKAATEQAMMWYDPDNLGASRMAIGNAIRMMCRAKRATRAITSLRPSGDANSLKASCRPSPIGPTTSTPSPKSGGEASNRRSSDDAQADRRKGDGRTCHRAGVAHCEWRSSARSTDLTARSQGA